MLAGGTAANPKTSPARWSGGVLEFGSQ